MTNKEILIKQIIYRAMHRGTKEMDLLLGSFVKKYINEFNISDLEDLEKLLSFEDDIIHNWYFKNNVSTNIPNTKVSKFLKNFKL